MVNLVHRYLMCSYAYYVLCDSLITDEDFDSLSRQLLAEYDQWKDHPHCPSLDDLRAGTYLGSYPTIVEQATAIYLRRISGNLTGYLS